MESIIAEPRTVVGKAVKSLRKRGMLPAVVYGKGKDALSISVLQSEFLKLWKSAGESSLVSLKIGKEEKNALIHDVSFDPIKSTPTHVDFYLVDMTHEVEVDVPIEFIGDEEAGKASGGILLKILHELKIKALPQNLPHTIVVDVSTLQNPKDSILVKDIKTTPGVVIINDVGDLVAIIEEARASEAEEVISTDVAGISAEAIKNIEVVKEKKISKEDAESAGSEEK
ncbi:MAG: 50S ribosomal protein L25 [Patescibacteria group bacterium]